MTERTPLPKAIREDASRWFAAREADELDAQGKEALRRWLAADPLHRQAFGRAEAVWAALDGPLRAHTWAPPSSRSMRSIPSRPWNRVAFGRRSAFGGALAASLALALIYGADLPMRFRADAMTAIAEQRRIALPDGSTALLDTNSAIAIETNDGRNIAILRGEAAFTVAQGAAPFVVRSNGGSATALGTRFVVRRDDGDTRIAVTEHSVRVDQAGTGAVVPEGWEVRYNEGGIGKPERIAPGSADAWTRGKLRVVNRPLGEVVAELGRYHSGYIGIAGAGLAELPVSGVFDLRNPVAAIDVIEQTLGLGSSRLTDRIIILHRA